jgi:large subunit ribosomal protein L11
MASVVEVLVPGGRANPGPPLGPALGPMGINIKAVVDEINKITSAYNGMQVPVKVIVDDNKNFTLEVGTPPTASLVLTELGVEKGSGNAGSEAIGNLTMEQLVKIAGMKQTSMLSYNLKNRVKEIIGTCTTLGATIENLTPKEAHKAIDEGKFDSILTE